MDGLVAVSTRETVPRMKAPLADDVVHYAGQHVGVVMAETLEVGQAAACRPREALLTLAVTTSGSVMYRCDPVELQRHDEAIVCARDGRRDSRGA